MRLILEPQKRVEKGEMIEALRWKSFPESIFSVYSREAKRLGAVNLAQGFPNFDGPPLLLECMKKGLSSCSNQYAPSRGDQKLRELITETTIQKYGFDCNADDTFVTSGATEAIFSIVLGIVNPGERVLVFEPFYESYRQSVAAAGGQFVTLRLLPPATNLRESSQKPSQDVGIETEVALECAGNWQIDWTDFDAATSLPFRLIIVNTPHNPTGLTLGHEALNRILVAARKYGAAVVSDEVYEDLVFSGSKHVSLLEVAKPQDLACRVTSIAKSYGFTGFKLGWAQGNAKILSAALKVHEAALFSVSTHTQAGFALFLDHALSIERAEYLCKQKELYESRLEAINLALLNAGFLLGANIQGGYFVCASAQKLSEDKETDVMVADRLMKQYKVAALPLSAFCVPKAQAHQFHPLHSQTWLRFAFCKTQDLIDQASENLSRLKSS